jgi:hypothetical protein
VRIFCTCIRETNALHSFGGYDTIRDTFLVGNLRGNFAASFAVGWVCTTVSRIAYDNKMAH